MTTSPDTNHQTHNNQQQDLKQDKIQEIPRSMQPRLAPVSSD